MVPREVERNSSVQAAVRAIGVTTTTINIVTSSLGLVFYGAAAMVYGMIRMKFMIGLQRRNVKR